MKAAVSPKASDLWLKETGVAQLEMLQRAILFNPSVAQKPNDVTRPKSATYLLNYRNELAMWSAGATELYGWQEDEVAGANVTVLCGAHESAAEILEEGLKRSATEGYHGVNAFQSRKDGSQFWASIVTIALFDEAGCLHGFATVVRDFSGRPNSAAAAITGIVLGEFGRITEANDIFLDMVGYERKDFGGELGHWAELTPLEYGSADERAHEEQLRFGVCTPYEKELVHKNGVRIPVQVVTAVLKLVPFRWVTFVQDLRNRDRLESTEVGEAKRESEFSEIVGDSTLLKRVLRQVELVAPTDATVLILGETGTGKELIAKAIHRLSPRQGMPCITLNCAAIPTGLLESELFGYERGAFTGALGQKIGRFEMANRGTLFLDEVGDIPLDLQPKLLRALQEKSFERLGGTRTIPIDVRLVAATNRNLEQMMEDKLFRSDLYYRLKVFPITIPPLRDRPEDIPALVRHFIQKYSRKMARTIDKIPTETMQALVNWSWPGNIRELENFIERAVILSRGPNLRAPLGEIQRDAKSGSGSETLEQVERQHILKVFRESSGVVTTTATRLGLHRTTLNAMMRKLGINRGDL